MKKVLFIACILASLTTLAQGNVGIGTANPNPSAILDLYSNTKGFGPPTMTSAERNLIPTPRVGLMIYNSTLLCPEYYNGTIWECAGSSHIHDTTTVITHDTVTVVTTVTTHDTVFLSPTVTNTTIYVDSLGSHNCHTDTVWLSAAQLATLGTNPVQIIPTPGPNNYLAISSVAVKFYPGSQPFAQGGEFKFFLDPLCNSNEYFALPGLLISSTAITTAVGMYTQTGYIRDMEDTGYYMRADYNPWITGNGIMRVVVSYCIVGI